MPWTTSAKALLELGLNDQGGGDFAKPPSLAPKADAADKSGLSTTEKQHAARRVSRSLSTMGTGV